MPAPVICLGKMVTQEIPHNLGDYGGIQVKMFDHYKTIQLAVVRPCVDSSQE
jgi:hypothetical protein